MFLPVTAAIIGQCYNYIKEKKGMMLFEEFIAFCSQNLLRSFPTEFYICLS
jgi:hypothetical protein